MRNSKPSLNSKLRLDDEKVGAAAAEPCREGNDYSVGREFASVWNDPAGPMVLKKRITRTLINEIIVNLDDDTQQLHFILHWHGGCHTRFEMPKPLSGALLHKTALEDVDDPQHGDAVT